MTEAQATQATEVTQADQVQLTPNAEGNVRCPLCHRTCSLPYFVTGHLDHHRFTVDGEQRAELDVALLVTIRDRYDGHGAPDVGGSS